MGIFRKGSLAFPPRPVQAPPSTQTKIFLLSPFADLRPFQISGFFCDLLISVSVPVSQTFQTVCPVRAQLCGPVKLATFRTEISGHVQSGPVVSNPTRAPTADHSVHVQELSELCGFCYLNDL